MSKIKRDINQQNVKIFQEARHVQLQVGEDSNHIIWQIKDKSQLNDLIGWSRHVKRWTTLALVEGRLKYLPPPPKKKKSALDFTVIRIPIRYWREYPYSPVTTSVLFHTNATLSLVRTSISTNEGVSISHNNISRCCFFRENPNKKLCDM